LIGDQSRILDFDFDFDTDTDTDTDFLNARHSLQG